MPKVSTIPLTNHVVAVSGDFTFSTEDATADITQNWAGGTITLPGSAASPVSPPSDGDFYEIADPFGVISKTKTLSISGGGTPLVWKGGLTSLASGLTGFIPIGCITFTFDPVGGYWYPCPGIPSS
jgi:hypothetical protein